jgi:hypothetical protein
MKTLEYLQTSPNAYYDGTTKPVTLICDIYDWRSEYYHVIEKQQELTA